MPTYRIDRPNQDKPRVVDAANPAQARQHVAKDELKVTSIGASEAFKLAGQGVELEQAVAAVAEEPQQQQQSQGGEDEQQIS